MSDCLFCGIVSGSIPSTCVAESKDSYAFRDINPVAPTHVLVIPRRHVPSVLELTPQGGDLLGDLFALVNEVAHKEGIAESGFRVVANVGSDAGMAVHHLHLHVIGGRPLGWPPERARARG